MAAGSPGTSPAIKEFLLAAEQVTYMNRQKGLASLEFQLSADCSELLARDTAAKNYSWK